MYYLRVNYDHIDEELTALGDPVLAAGIATQFLIKRMGDIAIRDKELKAYPHKAFPKSCEAVGLPSLQFRPADEFVYLVSDMERIDNWLKSPGVLYAFSSAHPDAVTFCGFTEPTYSQISLYCAVAFVARATVAASKPITKLTQREWDEMWECKSSWPEIEGECFPREALNPWVWRNLGTYVEKEISLATDGKYDRTPLEIDQRFEVCVHVADVIPEEYRTEPMSQAEAGVRMGFKSNGKDRVTKRKNIARKVARRMRKSDPEKRLRHIPVGENWIFDTRQVPKNGHSSH